MDKSAMFDKALEMLSGDMDDLEGSSAMHHSLEECPDPLNCTQHEDEAGESLTPGDKPALTIAIHGAGIAPGEVEGEKKGGVEDSLSDDEKEELKKLLR